MTRHRPSLIFLVSAALLLSIHAQASLPPAYLPLFSAQSLTPAAPTTSVVGGFFRLTPRGCSGGQCTGFRLSNTADFSSKTNSVVFTPTTQPVMVEPFGSGLYEIGMLTITNGGFLQPTDARMTVVPLKGMVTISNPGVNKPTNVALNLQVMWSLGSPSPVNQAGLFVLVTKNPTPSYNFKVAMTSQIDFPMNLKVVGFRADSTQGAEVLGDWGQPKPPPGEPGPRVYVKQGAAQVLRLFARICNTNNPNNPSCKS